MIAAAWRVGSIVLLLASAADVDGVKMIETPGAGTLTVCVGWMPLHGCDVYEKVELPHRVAVGDTLELDFGDAQHFDFPVARIIKNGLHCTVLSDADGDADKTDTIKVSSCLDVSGQVRSGQR